MPQARRAPNWTEEEDRKLLDMVAAGKSWVRISAALKRPLVAVRDRARTLKRRDAES
jgi:Myb-like DNA-binding domain